MGLSLKEVFMLIDVNWITPEFADHQSWTEKENEQ